MSRTIKSLLIGATVLAGVTSANSASATQLTYYYDSLTNNSFTALNVATSSSTPATVGQFTASFAVPNFNSSLGTLNSITVSFTIAGQISALDNGAAGDAYSNVIVGIPYQLNSAITGTGAISVSGEGYADTPPGNGNAGTSNASGAGFTGTLATTGTNVIGTNTFSLSGSSFSQTISGANLLPYISSSGSASFNFRTRSADIVQGQIPQNDLIGANSLETVKVTIVEDYTPAGPPSVPEPASIALLGAGLLGLGLIRRKA